MIYTLFLVLILLAAVLMIGIVLIQESKGGGLGSLQHRMRLDRTTG